MHFWRDIYLEGRKWTEKGLFVVLCLWLFQACQPSISEVKVGDTLFTTIPAAYSGIDFQNAITYTEDFNPYTFRNFFNGGGVALGDINNDGLVDIYFSGNLEDNKLYLNKGDFRFEDITQKAGVACPNVWSSGVTMADINADGLLDIYVCKSGSPEGDNRYNELFINNGDLTFTEQANAYGLDDLGLSTHAVFFDYDKDGDLDCYLLNNSIRSVGGYDLVRDQRKIRDTLGGNKLYQNTGQKFEDVSEEAGIYGSAIGFGLGVTIGDVNKDGWQDIYVSNDFFEKDYLYLNQQDGTFAEVLEEQIQEISLSSMGADMADVNNDGYPEIFVTDMLPATNARMKTKTNFENWNKYQKNLRTGYYRQFSRNAFQLNNGDGTFSELGRMLGIHATDWSWGALIADLDNDGLKDIFVANGILKDLTDQDYVNFYASPRAISSMIKEDKGNVITQLVDMMPSQAIANAAFMQKRRSSGVIPLFEDRATALGLAQPSFSNGSAYGDLDNDGDLDLVVNNLDMPAFLYRNESDTLYPDRRFLTFEFKGQGKNTFALGTQVSVYKDDQVFYQELAPMRGFQSCIGPQLHMGLGTFEEVDSIVVLWPDLSVTKTGATRTNQQLVFQYQTATSSEDLTPKGKQPLFLDYTRDFSQNFTHQENDHQDFIRERLLYHMLSSEGPKVAKGDVTGDGREDLYFCGAKDQPGELWVQRPNGTFAPHPIPSKAFIEDARSEDTDALFVDVDGDRDLDLYVTSGGSEFSTSSAALKDRIYLNQGKGVFKKKKNPFRGYIYESAACVRAGDYDRDGDQDLFVGVRTRPGVYGVPVNGFILNNDGKGNFTNVTEEKAPQLVKYGMMTDAQWIDWDGDQDLDLVVAGEWLPITIWENQEGSFVPFSQNIPTQTGLWTCVEIADLNEDGKPDLLLGNHGLNSRLQAGDTTPVEMFVNDFDRNGAPEQLITVYQGDKSYPLALRQDVVMQMPGLKKQYLKYASYKDATIEEMFPPQILARSYKWSAQRMETSIWLSQSDGSYAWGSLPLEAQMAPVYGMLIEDLDGDGHLDILLGGNFSRSKPEIGIYAASYGTYLKGNGKGDFESIPNKEVGLKIKGEVRDIVSVKTDQGKRLVVAKNDAAIQWLKINR